MTYVCLHCRKPFTVDHLGRRPSDLIISERFCSWDCNLAYVEGKPLTVTGHSDSLATWSRCPRREIKR